MKRRAVSKEAVKRVVVRSTKASAQLENRVVPAGYKRSARVESFLVKRRLQV
ncbi:hypothetical protein ACFO5K_13560 [Nocardia halotolerans]|uniref:Uncharacterized protein n=1 Tax=Nocardia halotolerans TaxID=1755878 RepID=A0ABV8VI39_9NOCA